MAIGDLFLNTFEMNVGNHPASFTLGYEQIGETGSVSQELTSLCATACAGDFGNMNFFLSESCTLEAVKSRKLTGTPNPYSQVKLQNVKGQVSGDAIPLTKSVMVTHKQRDAGVRSNGKTYIPGFAESSCDIDKCTNDGFLTFLKTTMDNLLLVSATFPIGSADFRMVVISRPGGPNENPVGLEVVSNSVSSTLFNSQRRRTREYGYSEIVI